MVHWYQEWRRGGSPLSDSHRFGVTPIIGIYRVFAYLNEPPSVRWILIQMCHEACRAGDTWLRYGQHGSDIKNGTNALTFVPLDRNDR